MSFLGLDLAHNYSFYAIPVVYLTCMAPHFYAISVYNAEKAVGASDWDNRNPKANIEKVKEAKLSPTAQGKFLRAEAAQENGFQNLPLFAAGILAGNFARLSPTVLNVTAAAYIVSRIIYTFVYITNESTFASNARSAIYLTGVATWISLFVRAGNKLF